MKKMTSFIKNFWKDESAQGATEYIILLIVVVAVALIFKDRIKELVGERINELGQGLSKFTSE